MKVRISRTLLEGMGWKYKGKSDFVSFVMDADPVEAELPLHGIRCCDNGDMDEEHECANYNLDV